MKSLLNPRRQGVAGRDVPGGLPGSGRVQVVWRRGDPALVLDRQWDALAQASSSPFSSSAWLIPWYRQFRARPLILTVHEDGRLRAGIHLQRRRGGGISSASNQYTDEWSALGADEGWSAVVWDALAASRAQRIALRPLPEPAALAARTALEQRGYAVVQYPDLDSPRLELPQRWDDLWSKLSKKSRSTLRRKENRLADQGHWGVRISEGDRLAEDMAAFLRLEASGWKGGSASAIASKPSSLALYQEFAARAAAAGWLRLLLLELDGQAIAADLSCVLGSGCFQIKSAYDERFRAYSPGLLLRLHALRAAIEGGSRFYDFLGEAEKYKLRWGAVPRSKVRLHAYRGPALAGALYHRRLRPVLKAARDLTVRSGAPETGDHRH